MEAVALAQDRAISEKETMIVIRKDDAVVPDWHVTSLQMLGASYLNVKRPRIGAVAYPNGTVKYCFVTGWTPEPVNPLNLGYDKGFSDL